MVETMGGILWCKAYSFSFSSQDRKCGEVFKILSYIVLTDLRRKEYTRKLKFDAMCPTEKHANREERKM
jgi:hypothetical protein